MKAIIYCRVSTKEQVENFSLGSQEKACRDYAKRNNFEVDSIFIESAVTVVLVTVYVCPATLTL